MNERLAAQRAAQGLPPTIEDPVILARVAELVLANDGNPGVPNRGSLTSSSPLVERNCPDGTPTAS